MRYYPIYLDLRGRDCFVIGGGAVAEGKVAALLECGAAVTVIAPSLTRELTRLRDAGRLRHIDRAYRRGDLEGAFLAIGATDDRVTNREIWQEAEEWDIPLNVVDDPPHCSFIAPSVMRRGDLAIAISTAGRAPALAVRLREQLERLFGAEHARFLELAGTIREALAARTPDFQERKARWYRLVDSDVLDLLRRGDEVAARRRMAEIMGVEPAGEENGRGAIR
jgi:siroheme synthase-like protein